MARVSYTDEFNQRGELRLEELEPGDRVRFLVDHRDPAGYVANEGTIAELLDSLPTHPGLVVITPVRDTMGNTAEAELFVHPEEVTVMVHSQDPRIGSQRIADRLPGGLGDDAPDDEFDARQLEKGVEHELEHTLDTDIAKEIAKDHLTEDPAYYDHLVACLVGPVLRGYRGVVTATLVREGYRAAAGAVAKATDASWASYLGKTAAAPGDWVPLVLWSLKAFETDFPGSGPPDIRRPRHVVWALEANADDIESTLPAHEVDDRDEDTLNREIAAELRTLAKTIGRMTDRDWQAQLPQLALLMHDPELQALYGDAMRNTEAPTAPALGDEADQAPARSTWLSR